MDLVVFVIGFLGLIVALVMLIVYAVKKKSKKIPSIILAISLVLMVTGLSMEPSDSDQNTEELSTNASAGITNHDSQYEELTLEEITVLKKHYKDFTASDVMIFERIVEKGESLSPEEFEFYYENVIRLDKEMNEFEEKSESESESEPESELVEKEPDETLSQKNAVKMAENYLSITAFSKKGLIEQLEFEGFDTEDATYAANKINVNWKEQAVRMAENYLSITSFSRKGLIEQLEFEGFTKEEANYAADEIGF